MTLQQIIHGERMKTTQRKHVRVAILCTFSGQRRETMRTRHLAENADDMKSSPGKVEKMTRLFAAVHRSEEAERSQDLLEGQVHLDSELTRLARNRDS